MEIRYNSYQSALPAARPAANYTHQYEINDSEIKKEVFRYNAQATQQNTQPKTQAPPSYMGNPEKKQSINSSLSLIMSDRADVSNKTPENYFSLNAIKTYRSIDQQKDDSTKGDLISRMDYFV